MSLVIGRSSLETLLVCTVAVLGSALTGANQVRAQTLRGLVLERDTQAAIQFARVTLIGPEQDSLGATLTDEDGFFSISAAEQDDVRLVASALGYRGVEMGPYELVDGAVQVLQILLGPRPVPLPGITVSAERLAEPERATLVHTGFYDRLAEGEGEFLTPGEIAHSPIRHTSQLFREMTLVELWPVLGDRASAPWNDRVLIRSLSEGHRLEDRLCQPRVYVDDAFIDLENMDPQPSLEDLAPRADLEAVEVYRAPFGAPLRYQGVSPCGVILLWTRNR